MAETATKTKTAPERSAQKLSRLKSAEDLENLRVSIIAARDPNRVVVTVCTGTGCQAYGSSKVADAFRAELAAQIVSDKVEVRATGCHGFCERGPLVVIRPEGILYQQVSPGDVAEIVSETVVKNNVIDRLLYVDPSTGEKIVHERDVPFYKRQRREVFGNNGYLDPTSVEDYLALGGYAALAKVLYTMTPEAVIETVKGAGLRGRGGGGFPTGVKWETCRKTHGDIRYVICNADEGDPGAYMDRSLLEGNPHSVIEGMVIGAFAIGSPEGYIYVRNEYPLAVKNVHVALRQVEELGLLGEDILGSGFGFTIKVNRGGGAFVCGESTALMASLEGKVGEPRAKYIHTVESGLWEKPSNLNNVETWANVPLVINKGAEWYAGIGTDKSKGTKLFSLVGKVNNTGLVEVPMGMTLREIIYEIGGGVPAGRKFKAVQTGGPSGGCIPDALLDLPVDYESLSDACSMMGSGGMIVMDDRTCMVDVARYFVDFLKDESCGKCVPCREGLIQMSEILGRIVRGNGVEEDVDRLERLAEIMTEAALCALGSTAANPVLSTLRYFRDEYEAHIRDKRCPARVCRALLTYSIIEEKCTGCGACARKCLAEAISGEKKEPHTIDVDKCSHCGVCLSVCKFDAVTVE